jgi:membrane fusion protein (multidrug efflux system)
MAETEAPPTTTTVVRVKKARGRGLVMLLVLLVLLGAAAPFAWSYWQHMSTHEETDDAFIEARVVHVSARVPGPIVKVYVKDNEQVEKGQLLAEIDPRDYQTRVEQRKAALRIAEEKHASARESVALTDVTSSAGIETAQSTVQMAESGVERARTAVETAQENVQAARARQSQAEAQIVIAQRNYEQARAQIPAAQAEAQRSSADLKRYQDLYKLDEVSRQQLDRAQATSREAQATLLAARRRADAAYAQIAESRAAERTASEAVDQAQSQVAEARAKVGEAQAQVSQARGQLASANAAPQQVAVKQTEAQAASADIEQAKVAVREAELNLSYAKIAAPETGRVTKKAIEVGTYVQPGQALMAIVPYDVWVVANFKETQLRDMKPGQPVEVHVDAYPGRVYKAHVDSIQAGTGARFSIMPPENATGNHVKIVQRVPVKIVFDEPEEKLRDLGPGMSVVPEVKVR